MRIAVVEFSGRGGLIQYAYQLCRALAAAGADVTLITSTDYELAHLPQPFHLDTRLRLWDPKPAGGARPSSPGRRLLRGLRYYREWTRLIVHLARSRPDVVQLGDVRFAADLACVLALRALGLRVTDICHNVEPFSGGRKGGMPRRSRVQAAAFGVLYRSFHVVFAHFEVGRRALLARHGLPEHRVAVIPHGDESLFEELRDPGYAPEQVRAELGIAPEQPLVLLLGTLTTYKGVDHLLRSFTRVAARLPAARLAVVGFPAADFDVSAARRRRHDLGLDDAVRIVPRYVEAPQVAAWLEAASVAVFPYRAVSQSGALLLAQTFGVPVVATRVGAMEYQVEDGVTGLLVAPEDEAALADALLRVLCDPEHAAAIGRRAAERVRVRLAWRRVAALVLERYAALVPAAAAEASTERARP